MRTRLDYRDEQLINWYVDISDAEVSGLRSGLGPALDQARTRVSSPDSEPVTERMIDAARRARAVRDRLARCGKANERVLVLAYAGSQDRELSAMFSRLANLAALTEAARGAFKRAQDRKRAKGRRFVEWLRITAKNDNDLRTLVATEASQMLTRAGVAWESAA